MASKEQTPLKPADSSARRPDSLADAAKIVQDAAEKLIQFSRETAGEMDGELKEKAQLAEKALASGVESTRGLIKKYPLESALVCFGVGAVVGMLLKNRD